MKITVCDIRDCYYDHRQQAMYVVKGDLCQTLIKYSKYSEQSYTVNSLDVCESCVEMFIEDTEYPKSDISDQTLEELKELINE